MKKFLLLLISFFCVIIVDAQIQPQKPSAPNFTDTSYPKKFKRWQLPDSLINSWQQKRSPLDRMSLAGSMPKRFRYLGNNQKGFEVYQTYQDFMYILKPDSTFISNMPVLKTMPVTGEKKK